MARMLLIAAILAAATAFGQTPPATGTDFETLSRQFEYDAARPLDVETRSTIEREGATVRDISYAGAKGDRVDAYLVLPKTDGPHPAVLFGHWGQGNRAEFLPEAILYARRGTVSLLPANPWTRSGSARKSLRYFYGAENDRELYIEAVDDLRRGLDLLLAWPGVDASKLAYVGHSYGAQWGAILTAVDRRIRATVLMTGVPDAATIWLESDDPEFAGYRAAMPDTVRRYAETLSSLDAIRYVPQAAPTPLLFQFARFEALFGEKAMRRYYAAASEPKEELWYDCGHDMNDPQALVDRSNWIAKQLGLSPIVPPVRAPAGRP